MRIFNLVLIIMLFSLGGCAKANEESASVYQAFFDGLNHGIQVLYIQAEPALPFSAEYLSEEDEKFLNNFKFISLDKTHTKDTFEGLGVHLLEKSEIENLSSNNNCEDYWKKFYSLYPKAKSLIKISKVGFRNHGKEAVFYIEVAAGCLAGTGSIMHLAYDDGQWVLKNHINLWIS